MIPRPPTLFLRLLLLTLPVEFAILTLFGIWLVRESERRDEAAFNGQLRVQREAMLGGAGIDASGMPRVDPDLNRRALAPGTKGCLLDGEGAILWESPQGWFNKSGLRASSKETTECLWTIPMGGDQARVLSAAKRLKRPEDADTPTGPLVEVFLAKPLSGLQKSQMAFRRRASATAAALLGLTALLLWAAIKAGLHPVGAIIRKLRFIPGPAGTRRLEADLVPWELRPLTLEINNLLDRLWGLVQMEKRFTAEAAHELRTPLTIVKSTLQTALLEGKDHERALHEALEDLQRLERTAESLLVLARADALLLGQPQAFEEISLPEIFGSVAARYAPEAAKRDLEMALDLAPSVVHGQHQTLERLFVNLLDNAVKYTESRGLITLRCAPCDGAVLAMVENSGPPIPEEERPHLFERFFRGTAGRAETLPGTGLGLSIASAMARLQGAQLVYEPCGQSGNRFVVRFPLSRSGRLPPCPAQEEGPGNSPAPR